MYLILLLLFVVDSTTCARILGIFPTPFYSHQSVFQPLWRELSIRGHEVTVITTSPLKNTSLSTLKEIDLSFTYKLVYDDHKMQHVINTESNLLVLMKHVFFIMNNMTTEQLQHPEVQHLIESDENFDLIIVEGHVPAWFGFAKKYNCPLILITSMEATNFFRRIVGNINNPVFTHSFNLPFDNEMSFFRRVVCVIFEIFDEFQNSYLLYPIQQKIIRQALNDPEINLFDILKNVSLLFTNVIPGFNKVTINIPSVIQLNGLQIAPPKALPEDLQQFLDGATEGFIFLSLGSNVQSHLVSKEKQKILLKVFSELPFRILWKFEDEVSELPQNVKVMTWAPQQDILRHKNMKLFITQGGIQSLDEALRFRVPILGLPFFGDQFYNVMRVKDLQLGTWLDIKTLNDDVLKETILDTIDNKRYLENLQEISELMQQPPNSLDKAVWWVEYVIRHGQALHLRSRLADIPFYQYYLFDVILFLSIILIFFVIFSLKLVAVVWRFWYKLNSNKLKIQ